MSSSSPVSSHSRQTQSPSRPSLALSSTGTIVTPQTGQIGGSSVTRHAANASPHRSLGSEPVVDSREDVPREVLDPPRPALDRLAGQLRPKVHVLDLRPPAQ